MHCPDIPLPEPKSEPEPEPELEPEVEPEPREPWATWTYMPGPRTWDLRKAPLFARTAQPGDPDEAHAEAEAADQALAEAQAYADAKTETETGAKRRKVQPVGPDSEGDEAA
jgi:hypothetical protein